MFAGTGAGREGNSEPEQKGALADILGVRPGDHILFYVEGYGFYGFFKAKQTNTNIVFYEPPEKQYLNEDLAGKTLTYRLFVEPSEYGVCQYGIDEWDAIESPENIEEQSIFNMQWTWIFKKLRARRGCTAIPKEEFQLLKNIITADNEKLENTKCYGFAEGEIYPSDQEYEYQGDTSKSPVLSGNLRKVVEEADLRIFLTATAGLDQTSDEVLNPAEYGRITYIANETKCSFGIKSIDLLFITDQEKCLLVELKNGFGYDDSILEKMRGYAQWVSSYKRYLEEIVPILIIREPRLYPKGSWGWKFKYLSQKDYQDNTVSPWYQNIIDKIQDAKSNIQDHKIDKLSGLKVYQFHTDEANILQSFSSS